MNRLRLCYYGDDFTGSTDALEQLAIAGIRAALFVEPPTPEQLNAYPELDAIGVCGITRSLTSGAMEHELQRVFQSLSQLAPRHIHYKVCSTFDSSPDVGSIGRAIDVAVRELGPRVVPVVVGAPQLGRYCVFGNLFARFGIGSEAEIYRLDRHPAICRHPVTPMLEADLLAHLADQTNRSSTLVDILAVERGFGAIWPIVDGVLGDDQASSEPTIVLFDVLRQEHLIDISRVMEELASRSAPLFSVGSSAIEAGLAAVWNDSHEGVSENDHGSRRSAGPLLVASGSCSPVTMEQIAHAKSQRFAEIATDARALVQAQSDDLTGTLESSLSRVASAIQAGSHVIIHTAETGVASELQESPTVAAARIGTFLGKLVRRTLECCRVGTVCVAGGDTSSYAARALDIESLEMIATLTPGAPLCRARSRDDVIDGTEFIFKGGQVGPPDYFDWLGNRV